MSGVGCVGGFGGVLGVCVCVVCRVLLVVFAMGGVVLGCCVCFGGWGVSLGVCVVFFGWCGWGLLGAGVLWVVCLGWGWVGCGGGGGGGGATMKPRALGAGVTLETRTCCTKSAISARPRQVHLLHLFASVAHEAVTRKLRWSAKAERCADRGAHPYRCNHFTLTRHRSVARVAQSLVWPARTHARSRIRPEARIGRAGCIASASSRP